MKILISGSSGLVGSTLIPYLQTAGHQVERLVRKPGTGIVWNPQSGYIDRDVLEGFDVVIHLAAENIGSGYWTKNKKDKIFHSRVNGTSLLAEAITRLNRPPKIFISASAIGFYGDRGNDQLVETSLPGNSYLALVCKAWEAAAHTVSHSGIRAVQTRFGLILTSHGGILGRLTLPFKFGFGVKLGSGNQYQPWVVIDDVLAAIDHIINTPGLEGPINVVAPQTVTHGEFTRIIGQILHRPVLFSIPSWLLKLILGEMAQELLLASAWVVPEKLTSSGFKFRFSSIENALQLLLAKR